MLARSANVLFLSSSLQLVFAALSVAWTGCCGPYICSQQAAYSSASKGQLLPLQSDCGKGVDCGQGCNHGQLKLGLPRPLLHAISGPFVPHEIVDPYQSTVQVPHSKFHPVPTRPVFAPLDEIGTRSGGIPQPSPTLATPPSGRPTLAPQEDDTRREIDDPQRDDRPQESDRPPRLLPSQTPAELIPPPTSASTERSVRSPRRTETPAQPSIRAASAEARFVER
jgi:hypothetical protein